jgi:hypothetical protein
MTDAPVHVTVVPAKTANGDRFVPRYAWARAGEGRTEKKRAASPTLAIRRTDLRNIQSLLSKIRGYYTPFAPKSTIIVHEKRGSLK